LFLVVIILPLYLNSPASATQSRLSAMGDLSIVIEDESNMIDLWDFSRNPAGFLEDEEGSVIRGDFIWDTYQIKNLTYTDYQNPFHYSKYKVEGDLIYDWISLGLRKKEDFAVGIEGNYRFQKADSRDYTKHYTSPKAHLFFSKYINPQTSFGVSIGYMESNWKLTNKPDKFPLLHDHVRLSDFLAEIGLKRELTPEVNLGVLLGYNSIESDEEYYTDGYAVWLSGQTVIRVLEKLTLGLETIFKYKKADLIPVSYVDDVKRGKEDYYYTYLRFRGIYDLSTKFRIGLFFSNNELFADCYEPLYSSLSIYPYELMVKHLGVGCSYKFSNRTLLAVEYHFRDSSQPYNNNTYIRGQKNESLNLGIEYSLSEHVYLRGGYVITETNPNPNYYKNRDNRGNSFTAGFGVHPKGEKFLVELSYRYALKEYNNWSSDGNVKSGENIISVSLKKMF
jgi:hypothetical protein